MVCVCVWEGGGGGVGGGSEGGAQLLPEAANTEWKENHK